MAKEQKQSFIKGAAILSASTLVVKVLGLLFSIPLANFISLDGMSNFYTAYDIFGFFLLLSTAGLPIAVSRMVGTAYAQGRKREADRVFSVAFWLFFIIGLLGCFVMLFFPWVIAGWMGNRDAGPAVIALAPTMFFISLMSALRGYFQGRSNMVPTAVSQIIEAVSKVIVGVGLAVFIITRYESDAYAAVGAIVGVSISAALGTAYLVLYKMRQNRRDKEAEAAHAVTRDGVLEETRNDSLPMDSSRQILKDLILFAIPITLGACFLSLLDLVDVAILMERLQQGVGLTYEAAKDLRGALGHARKFFDLPGSFVVPISTSLLPVLSAAIANRDRQSTNHIAEVSMRITFLISVPATIGMVIFALPISQVLLFNQQEAAHITAPLLSMLSLAICFYSTLFTTNAILQSFGKVNIPVIHMAAGGVVKVVLSYILIGIPEINVMGSAISTVVSYVLIMVLNFISIRKCLPDVEHPVKMAWPTVLASLVMGAAAYLVYYPLSLLVGSKVAVFFAIAVAVLVYALAAVRLKAVRYEDMVMLPKGEALARLLRMEKPK